eukprot:19733_1
MNKCMVLLFFIIAFINIIEGYQCRLYLYPDPGFGGTEYGPFDVGTHQSYPIPIQNGVFPMTSMSSMRIYAEGYMCHAKLYIGACGNGELIVERVAGPFQMASASSFSKDNQLNCAVVWSDATPKPTPHPSGTPSMLPSIAPTTPPSMAPSIAPTTPPSTAPTSSCLDYNNETSLDGNNEIREFNYKNIININNYHINKNIILEFNTSH